MLEPPPPAPMGLISSRDATYGMVSGPLWVARPRVPSGVNLSRLKPLVPVSIVPTTLLRTASTISRSGWSGRVDLRQRSARSAQMLLEELDRPAPGELRGLLVVARGRVVVEPVID